MPRPRPPVRPARRIGVIIVLPLLLAVLGCWQFSRAAGDVASLGTEADGLAAQTARMEAVAAATPLRIVRFAGDPMAYSASVAVGMMRDAVGVLHRGAIVARLREGLAAACVLGGAASLLAGSIGLAAAAWAGRRSRVSRAALDAAFVRVRTLLPRLLGTQIAGLALACGSALLFEVCGAWYLSAFNRIEGQAIAAGLAVAGFVLWLGWLTLRELRRSLAAFTPLPMPLFGREITEAEAPGLWRLVAAASHGDPSVAPEHIVVGLVDGFFVTSSTVGLAPAARLLAGRTLHIPLPALALLDGREAAAVIAHELAHFAGEDTAYGQRFMPTYAGITRNLDAMSLVNGASAVRWTQAPAFTLGLHMLQVFDAAVGHWTRQRELAADAASVAGAGADAVASALLRTSLVATGVQGLLAETLRHPRAAPTDLVAAVVEAAASRGLADPASVLQAGETHPGDTHPPPLQRIAALGVAADATLLARAARPPQSGDMAFVQALFADWGGLCAAVSRDATTFATEAGDRRAEQLRTVVAAQPETVTELFQDIRRPVIAWSATALASLAACGGMAYLIVEGQVADPTAIPMLVAVAAGLFAVALAGAACIVGLRRSARTPFLTLHAEGFACRGLDRMVPWVGVDRIAITASRTIYVFIHLLPITPLPKRVSGWAVRVGRRRSVITLMGLRPRGVAPSAYLGLVHRYWDAARARAALDVMEGGPGAQPPAHVAIMSAEELGL